jgi:SIR2-like domain
MQNTCDQSWQLLHSALKTHDLAFVLGAGISYPLMPSWPEFVRRLAKEADFEWPEGLDRSLPAITSLIRQHCEGKHIWYEMVRKCLYQLDDRTKKEALDVIVEVDMHKNLANEMVSQREFFMKYLNEQGVTSLPAIVDLCAAEVETTAAARAGSSTDGRSWRRNQRIGAILTYNFDALIQLYDRARHGTPRILRTIERASSRRYIDRIPVYHLHGYLRPTAGSDQDVPEALVLCEDEYHRRTDEPFSYAMTSMLSALREFVCVFVGCSMTDELMRRTLYRSAIEHRKHRKVRAYEVKKWHFATVERKSEHLDRLIERDLSALGVQPLWVDSFAELPVRLAALREDFVGA